MTACGGFTLKYHVFPLIGSVFRDIIGTGNQFVTNFQTFQAIV